MEKEYSWVSYIKQRIKKNKNMISSIVGPTGSGKSWSGLSVGEMLDDDFNIERVIFRARDLLKLVNQRNLPSGSVILWDEAGVDLSNRNWQSQTNKMLNYLIQTFRHRNFVLIFTTPFGDFVDSSTRKLFHAEFETISMNRTKETVTVKPKLLQYNSQMKKWYYHYLKIHKKDTGDVKIKRWSIPKPSGELVRQYEQAKVVYTSDLNIEIQDNLNVLNPLAKRKPLTENQERVLECWKKGVLLQREIGEIVGKVTHHVCEIEQGLRRKGYIKEQYRKNAKESLIVEQIHPKTLEPTLSSLEVPIPTTN